MSEKQFQSRTRQISDTESNWLSVPAFVPKSGELVVFNADENYEYPRMKIGDGVTPLSDLPFAYENRDIAVEDDGAGVVRIRLGVDELPAQNASGWGNAAIVVTSLAAGAEPTVSVFTAEDGHKVITIGIPKGDKGDKGAKGDKGDSPVKGVDYWTTADKNEIINSASTISGASEGSIVSLNASGKMVASSRKISSLGTGATYSLSSGTLYITTL